MLDFLVRTPKAHQCNDIRRDNDHQRQTVDEDEQEEGERNVGETTIVPIDAARRA